MTARKPTGRWQEFSDSKGIDAKYAEEELEAQRQLTAATAGPGKDTGCVAGPVASSVPPGDTGMKNPHGAFDTPAPNAGVHPQRPGPGPDGQSNRKPDGTIDPKGQQGGAIKPR